MNIKAFCDMVNAEEAYLLANGWIKVSHGQYQVPNHIGKGVVYQWQAVCMQRQSDSDKVRSRKEED